MKEEWEEDILRVSFFFFLFFFGGGLGFGVWDLGFGGRDVDGYCVSDFEKCLFV